MAGYGQFCSVARALELLGGRWSLLIVRELLCGSRRFGEIRRGVPRISRTMLSERLQSFAAAGILTRSEGTAGPEYALTEAGIELASIIVGVGTWGQRWLPRKAEAEDLDLEPLLIDMKRRVNIGALPQAPVVIRFELTGRRRRFMLLRPAEASLCTHNPGFSEAVAVRGALSALAGWWRGDIGFIEARRQGLVVEGMRSFAQAFPSWFHRYQLADVAPARP